MKTSEWICVKDRNPSRCDRIGFTYNGKDTCNSGKWFNNSNNLWEEDKFMDFYVPVEIPITHWMLYPDKPRDEND
jgi:hypothetical protein